MTGTSVPEISVSRRDGVGLIEIDHPPVNALSVPVRTALLAAIEQLDGDASVGAILIHGRGRHFIAGADVREFDVPAVAPLLNDVLLRLESAGKPVVAALHGTTLGGGAELGMASHYRAAAADLSFGLPEIKLGLLPGSGGTVRLPRLVGIESALELMTGGAPIGCSAAVALGLIDRELAGDLLEEALAYAHELIAAGAPVRRTRDLTVPPPRDPQVFTTYPASLSKAALRIPATRRIVAAVEAAATLPFEPALARARVLFEECRLSGESRALRHLFFAERGTRAAVEARPIHAIGVVGAGTMGGGIVISALTAGYVVTLVDSQEGAVEGARARIEATLEETVRKGRLSTHDAEAARGRLTTARSLEALAAADLVIEAVFENLAVKQALFSALGRICGPHAVLATNTSTLDVDAIAVASGRPSDVVGMHFFSPANIMRLVEIVRGEASGEDSLATALAVARRLGKIGIVVGNCFGFVGNRMLYAYGREKELMMLEGASPEQVDRALVAFGMAMGPNAVGDMAGLDIGYQVRREWREKPADPRFYRVSDLLVEHGRLGQKSGAGFYRYSGGTRKGEPDPEVGALIRAEAARLGVVERTIIDEEIAERCMLALVNEGAKLLDEGIAASADDIDAIWCNGYGFPRHRGGPMFYGETLGAVTVRERIAHYARMPGTSGWMTAALIERCAERGESLIAGPQVRELTSR